MSHPVRYRILLAEDDSGVRQSLKLVLESAGYDVIAAEHGVDAIFLLQKISPHVVIYELNLPRVQGHDFLAIVRMRFPQVSVVAMSSSSALEGRVPDGVFADAMYIKGHSGPEALLRTVFELIQTAETRMTAHKTGAAQAFAANQRARRTNVGGGAGSAPPRRQ
jgi:DNA-binding response OmpR family regulator